MKILLDTHILLWALHEPRKLGRQIRERLMSPEHDVLFSAASIWEIAIKSQIKRVSLPVRPEEIASAALESGFSELPVRSEAAAMVADLPMHHKDPFDRLLIAQAIAESARLCTIDKTMELYRDAVQFL